MDVTKGGRLYFVHRVKLGEIERESIDKKM